MSKKETKQMSKEEIKQQAESLLIDLEDKCYNFIYERYTTESIAIFLVQNKIDLLKNLKALKVMEYEQKIVLQLKIDNLNKIKNYLKDV